MSDNKCGTGIASQLTADTFIGTDCKGNKMNAGSKFASCSDLQDVKDGVSQTIKEAGIEAIRQTANNAKNNANDAKAEAGKATQKAEEAKTEAGNATNEAKDAKRDASNAVSTANGAVTTAQNALNKAIARVNAEGDRRDIVLQDGTKIPFYITDKNVPVEPLYQDEKVVGFGVKGDNVVITMIDGTEHDLTRQEFADWLSSQDSSLATDNELAEAIAKSTGNLQKQVDAINNNLDSLQAQIDAFDADQAMLFVRGDNLVLRNEDGTESEAPLTSLIPVSPDSGNLLTMRENGIYYGIEAEANLQKLYVDAEYGDDNVSVKEGGGTIEKPFKTLDRALRVVPEDNSNVVYLKSTDTNGQALIYTVTHDRRVLRGATRRLATYGDQPNIPESIKECVLSKSYHFSPSQSSKFVRPIVRFGWKTYSLKPNKYQAPYRLNGDGTGKWAFSGVAVELSRATHDKSVYTPRNTEIIGGSNVSFSACEIIDFGDENECDFIIAFGESNSVTFSDETFFTNPRSTGKYIYIYTGSLGLTIKGGYGIAFSNVLAECDPDGLLQPPIRSNVVSLLSRSRGGVAGVARHPSGVPLNVTANFNI